MSNAERAKRIAERFHEAYERLAPQFGYETRRESAKPWAEVPENNRNLMIAVCQELLSELPPESAQGSDWREADLKYVSEAVADATGKLECECCHRAPDDGPCVLFQLEYSLEILKKLQSQKAESAQEPRCPRCGSSDFVTGVTRSRYGVGQFCVNCKSCEFHIRSFVLADFAQFFGPAPEVRDLVETLGTALRKLRNEVDGWMQWDFELEQVGGVTNVNILKQRLFEAEAALMAQDSALAALKEKT